MTTPIKIYSSDNNSVALAYINNVYSRDTDMTDAQIEKEFNALRHKVNSLAVVLDKMSNEGKAGAGAHYRSVLFEALEDMEDVILAEKSSLESNGTVSMEELDRELGLED